MEKIKNEDFPYLKKPDRDNCIKSIQDSCTDAKLWKDDNQVYAGALEKYYSIKPRIELTLIY